MTKIAIKDTDLTVLKHSNEDYICITDVARYKNIEHPDDVIKNWLRNRNTIAFLGVWERLYNPNFNNTEFNEIEKNVELNSFVITPKKWIELTNAIGIILKTGRYQGTYANGVIAFEFASWISPEFKLYFNQEFQRLKEQEEQQLDWLLRRELSKTNYHIHTDAIKRNLISPKLTTEQMNIIICQ